MSLIERLQRMPTYQEATAELARLEARVAELERGQVEDAIVIGRLNSGKELQIVMGLNNELVARAEAAEAAKVELAEHLDKVTDLAAVEVVRANKAEARAEAAEKALAEMTARWQAAAEAAKRRQDFINFNYGIAPEKALSASATPETGEPQATSP